MVTYACSKTNRVHGSVLSCWNKTTSKLSKVCLFCFILCCHRRVQNRILPKKFQVESHEQILLRPSSVILLYCITVVKLMVHMARYFEFYACMHTYDIEYSIAWHHKKDKQPKRPRRKVSMHTAGIHISWIAWASLHQESHRQRLTLAAEL